MLKLCALASIYNGENVSLFEKCLQSLKAQTLNVDIFLIVDGPIRDELKKVILKNRGIFKEVWYLEKNQGLAVALNEAMEKIPLSYTHVIRFDTDDINVENRFKLIHDNLHTDTDLLASGMYEHDLESAKLNARKVSSNFSIGTFRFINSIYHPTVAFKLSTMRHLGSYDEVPGFEDWATWIKFAKNKCKFVTIDEPLVLFSYDANLINRRSGWHYFKKEYNFYKFRRQNKYFRFHVDIIFLISRFGKFLLGKWFTSKLLQWRSL